MFARLIVGGGQEPQSTIDANDVGVTGVGVYPLYLLGHRDVKIPFSHKADQLTRSKRPGSIEKCVKALRLVELHIA